MVVNVAAQAVAKAGTTGAKVAGKATAATARGGARASAASARAGARAGGRAGATAARSGSGATAGAARTGARQAASGGRAGTGATRAAGRAGRPAATAPPRAAKGLTDVRPGGARRPPSMPSGRRTGARRTTAPDEAEGDEQGGDGSGGGASGRRRARRGAGDPVRPAATGARRTLRALSYVSRPIKGRRRRRRIRRLLDLTEREKARQRRQRRTRRRLYVVAGVFVLLMSTTTVTGMSGMGEAGPAPGTGAGTAFGYVDGIPFADVFNSTAALGIDPRLVAAVAFVESSFAEDVIQCRRESEDHARGIMQLIPATAASLGVDPCDPEQAIPGGARYLLAQLQAFGSPELAAAAYNAGPGAVRDYGGIPPYAETVAYVPKVMAKWEEYIQRFPGGTVGTEAPFGPLGGTARYTESRITATTQRFLDHMVPRFGRGLGIGCYRNGSDGEHPLGRACDFIMQVPLNHRPTPQYLQHGWAFVNYCIAHADELDVRYVIWQKQIWQRGMGWREYTRYDPNGSLQQNHFDHVHVTLES